MRAALPFAIGALLVACTPDEAPTAEPSVEAPDTPRGPRGAEPARCGDGSDDPDDLARYGELANAGQLDAAIQGLEAAVGANPGSATARVRLGELLLRTQPPRAPLAATWFERGLALHDDGCMLTERDEWAALEGSGLSRMMQGDYAAARPFFERSLARWPSARATRYNLACTRCQTGDVDGCAEALTEVFAANEPPAFLGDQRRPPEHYRALATRDPDLAPLRADQPRFDAITGEQK